MNNEPKQQSLSAKKAESERPYHGPAVLDDPVVRNLFLERANIILDDLNSLQNRGIELSPFLEIGAGSIQRSAALINNYPVQGAATDISQQSLQDTPFVLSLLNYNLAPTLICCEAHHLPFLPNSFNFVFAYQTLHHFENPIPVLAESYRVLGKNGHLFFNEEPMDSSFRRKLRGKRILAHPPTRIQRMGYKLGVEKVFWDDGSLERSLGMTEARFDLPLWIKALSPFSIIDIEVNRKLRIHSDLQKPVLNVALSGLIGGNVKGLCRKKTGETVNEDFHSRLMCLDCYSTNFEHISVEKIICNDCNRMYPIVNNIIRMFPKNLEAELFPLSNT
jgi:SAM-dependent methyltransferase